MHPNFIKMPPGGQKYFEDLNLHISDPRNLFLRSKLAPDSQKCPKSTKIRPKKPQIRPKTTKSFEIPYIWGRGAPPYDLVYIYIYIWQFLICYYSQILLQ